MKKSILSIFFLGLLNSVTGQELDYGVILGFNAYDVEIHGPLIASSGTSGVNIGGFADYQLNSSFGLRGNLLYTSVEETSYGIIENLTLNDLYKSVNYKTIQFHTLVRYDVNKDYNKGFYLTGGVRMNHVLSAKGDDENLPGFYKKINLGAMLGFGVNFAKHFGIELLPEVNLTNTLDSNENRSRNYGCYANLTINLESILRK